MDVKTLSLQIKNSKFNNPKYIVKKLRWILAVKDNWKFAFYVSFIAIVWSKIQCHNPLFITPHKSTFTFFGFCYTHKICHFHCSSAQQVSINMFDKYDEENRTAISDNNVFPDTAAYVDVIVTIIILFYNQYLFLVWWWTQLPCQF